MKKIISLFQRNHDGDRLVRDEVVPGAEWVIAGEGTATRKFDGTACRVRAGLLFKRYDAKGGRTPPLGFEPSQEQPDPVTGHWPGWMLVSQDAPEDRWFLEAWIPGLPDGTYELCGPKVQGNPEGFQKHTLVQHGAEPINGDPRSYTEIKHFFACGQAIEGIVWHHSDGRMVKIKAKDFGIRRLVGWPVKM